ncbi:MAG TPA: beta-propeller domain-containing protein [Jatrophihabitans sp.]|nr:beta-propeller domain-containing protein [Jatrophihabitans sp.]
MADDRAGDRPDQQPGDELNSWLRAVRPATAADQGWQDSRAADELLVALHRRLAPTVGRRAGRRRRSWLLAGASLAAAAVLVALVLVAGLLPGQSGRSGRALPVAGGSDRPHPSTTSPQPPAIRPAAMLLNYYSSCPQLLADLRSHTAASVTQYGLPGVFGGYDLRYATAQDALPTATGASQTSTTNVQETGVDEPDIVKTEDLDGGRTRLISITGGTLRVIDAGTRQLTGSLDLSIYAGWQNAELLVDGDHALVLLGSSGTALGGGVIGGIDTLPVPTGGVVQSGRSSFLFVDLAGQPKVTGSLRTSGYSLDARLVGSVVRLVVRSAPTVGFPNSPGGAQGLAANQRIVRQAPLTAWLPQYTVTDGTASSTHTVACDQVSHPAAFSGASMLTVYTLDLARPAAADPQPISVAADGDTVYATTDSLYIASNPAWFCCQSASQRTQLHRFDISRAGAPSYLGSGSVPGRLLNRYSLSDYAGSLRVATTSEAGTAASSAVYVLRSDTLAVTGKLIGLGRDEQIYAVRFLGPMGYLVTFRQTDPLYVIDLHNPAAPRLAGALSLTGYSNYLHDAGDSRLIGVGQQAGPDGRVAGLQVSLFDVRTPAKPTLVDRVVRSDAPGEQALDPHAFLYWQPTGLVVVPVQSWTAAQSGKVLVLRVAGGRLRALGLLANPVTPGAVDDGQGIQRSLLVRGMLWTVSSSGVQVSNPSSLARAAWIPFS